MYPAYAKWIQSYRDLPLKLNQWNNVVVSYIMHETVVVGGYHRLCRGGSLNILSHS